jgi:hypothetical protein
LANLGRPRSRGTSSTRYAKWSGQGEEALRIQNFNAKLQESLDITHTRINGSSWWRGIKFKD